MENELISVLKGMPMFSAVDEQAVEACVHQCRVQKVHKGQMFFSPGQPADRGSVPRADLISYQLSVAQAAYGSTSIR